MSDDHHDKLNVEAERVRKLAETDPEAAQDALLRLIRGEQQRQRESGEDWAAGVDDEVRRRMARLKDFEVRPGESMWDFAGRVIDARDPEGPGR